MTFESLGGEFLTHVGEGEWGWHEVMGFGWFGAVFMLLFWVLIIAGIVWFVKWLVEQSSGGSPGTSKRRVLEILDEKYARGEIDDEEYEKRRRTLLRE